MPDPTPPTRPGTAPVDEAKLTRLETEAAFEASGFVATAAPELVRAYRALLAERVGLRKLVRRTLQLLEPKASAVPASMPMPDEPGFREWVERDCTRFAEAWDSLEHDLRAALAPAPAHADGTEAGQ